MRVIHAVSNVPLVWLILIFSDFRDCKNGFQCGVNANFRPFSTNWRQSDGGFQKPRHRQRLHYWNYHHHHDPNPDPNLDDLEETVTTEEIDQVLEEVTALRSGMVLNRDLDFLTLSPISVDSSRPKMTVLLDILKSIGFIWKSLSTLATLLLVFFVSQSFSFWRSVYDIARSIQGQMDDINLILASHAARRRMSGGTYSPEAQQFLEDIASKLRAYHVFMWARHVRRFRVLLTEKGFSRMVTKGVLSYKEKETLDMQLGVPKDQQHQILLEWIMFNCREARKKKILNGGDGMERILLDKICSLRDLSSQISSKTSGRMPLPYIQVVQILLDVFILLAPLAQYPDLGILTIFSVGIITLFYSGLFLLALIFLDPLDREGGFRDSHAILDMAVFIRESNISSSLYQKAASVLRWTPAS
eukprot:scaffold15397_cov93-Cylindrotheca_fusiformis.AAC.2